MPKPRLVHKYMPTCCSDYLYLSLFHPALDSMNGNQTPFSSPTQYEDIINLSELYKTEFVNKKNLVNPELLSLIDSKSSIKLEQINIKDQQSNSDLNDITSKYKDLITSGYNLKTMNQVTFDNLYNDGYFNHYIKENLVSNPVASAAADASAASADDDNLEIIELKDILNLLSSETNNEFILEKNEKKSTYDIPNGSYTGMEFMEFEEPVHMVIAGGGGKLSHIHQNPHIRNNNILRGGNPCKEEDRQIVILKNMLNITKKYSSLSLPRYSNKQAININKYYENLGEQTYLSDRKYPPYFNNHLQIYKGVVDNINETFFDGLCSAIYTSTSVNIQVFKKNIAQHIKSKMISYNPSTTTTSHERFVADFLYDKILNKDFLKEAYYKTQPTDDDKLLNFVRKLPYIYKLGLDIDAVSHPPTRDTAWIDKSKIKNGDYEYTPVIYENPIDVSTLTSLMTFCNGNEGEIKAIIEAPPPPPGGGGSKQKGSNKIKKKSKVVNNKIDKGKNTKNKKNKTININNTNNKIKSKKKKKIKSKKIKIYKGGNKSKKKKYSKRKITKKNNYKQKGGNINFIYGVRLLLDPTYSHLLIGNLLIKSLGNVETAVAVGAEGNTLGNREMLSHYYIFKPSEIQDTINTESEITVLEIPDIFKTTFKFLKYILKNTTILKKLKIFIGTILISLVVSVTFPISLPVISGLGIFGFLNFSLVPNLPSINIKIPKLPDLPDLPDLNLPNFNIPKIQLPEIDLFQDIHISFNRPSLNISTAGIPLFYTLFYNQQDMPQAVKDRNNILCKKKMDFTLWLRKMYCLKKTLDTIQDVPNKNLFLFKWICCNFKIKESGINEEYIKIHIGPNKPETGSYKEYFNQLLNLKNSLSTTLLILQQPVKHETNKLQYWGKVFWSVSCFSDNVATSNSILNVINAKKCAKLWIKRTADAAAAAVADDDDTSDGIINEDCPNTDQEEMIMIKLIRINDLLYEKTQEDANLTLTDDETDIIEQYNTWFIEEKEKKPSTIPSDVTELIPSQLTVKVKELKTSYNFLNQYLKNKLGMNYDDWILEE